jgi:hypothetical protein
MHCVEPAPGGARERWSGPHIVGSQPPNRGWCWSRCCPPARRPYAATARACRPPRDRVDGPAGDLRVAAGLSSGAAGTPHPAERLRRWSRSERAACRTKPPGSPRPRGRVKVASYAVAAATDPRAASPLSDSSAWTCRRSRRVSGQAGAVGGRRADLEHQHDAPVCSASRSEIAPVDDRPGVDQPRPTGPARCFDLRRGTVRGTKCGPTECVRRAR